MIINGRECGFRFTIGASLELAELCPGKDLSKFGELLNGKSYSEFVDVIMKMAIIFNKADEEAKVFYGEGKPVEPITKEEMLYLTNKEFMDMQKEIFDAYGIDTKRTVEVEPSKKNGAAKKKTGKSSSTAPGSASTGGSST